MSRNFDSYLEMCSRILRTNQISTGTHRYTRPAPHIYEQQWLWDSCFHAIVYRWFDVNYAKDELLSVIAKQVHVGADKGMIPHMNYWAGGGSELWGIEDRSIITQPPLIAVAALRVHEQARDLAWLAEIYAADEAYHEWFDRRRDPDKDELVSLIHAWEAGSDFSPRWDAAMGLENPTLEQSRLARKAYVRHLMDYDCNAERLSQDGFFSVEPVDFNAIRAADLECLASIARLLGKDAEAERWQTKANNIQSAIQNRMVFKNGIFDLSGKDENPVEQESNAPFVLLFAGCVDKDMADKLVQKLQEERFWTRYPIPNVPIDHLRFDPSIYWRGNVWMSFNWLIYSGLRRYGYNDVARELAKRSIELVEKHGFHEYFNPITGEGIGPSQQSWTTLILDMLASER